MRVVLIALELNKLTKNNNYYFLPPSHTQVFKKNLFKSLAGF